MAKITDYNGFTVCVDEETGKFFALHTSSSRVVRADGKDLVSQSLPAIKKRLDALPLPQTPLKVLVTNRHYTEPYALTLTEIQPLPKSREKSRHPAEEEIIAVPYIYTRSLGTADPAYEYDKDAEARLKAESAKMAEAVEIFTAAQTAYAAACEMIATGLTPISREEIILRVRGR